MGQYLRESRFRLIDLSLPISPSTAEPGPPRIQYVNHKQAATDLAAIATRLARQAAPSTTPPPDITEQAFPECLGLANENLELDTHAGTHMDAPWHFGPVVAGAPARTIDEVPIEWCFGPGVRLDLRHKCAGEAIEPQDLAAARARTGHHLETGDIVLLWTGADQHFEKADYFSAHPGMSREATLWLIERGVRVMGIDAWGFDR